MLTSKVSRNRTINSLLKNNNNLTNAHIPISTNYIKNYQIQRQLSTQRPDQCQYLKSQSINGQFHKFNQISPKLQSQHLHQLRSFHSSNRRQLQMQKNEEEDNRPALEKYGTDITQLAKDGKLDPVIGRDEEVKRTIQILSRKTKNNACLVGKPGVGKSAILESLAQRIVNGEVPDSMKGKKVISLDLAGIVSGSKYRGDFESKFKAIMKEIEEKHGEIIPFVDEFHTILSLGKSEGSMDASNMLKPALARGQLSMIGATTTDEYRKYIEKDQALARRFSAVLVTEPTVEDTISILRGLKERYEVHHGVRILDSALISAATLSNRYITERFLPDKAIDLVDEASSTLRLQHESKPDAISTLDRQIMTTEIELESLRKEDDPISRDRKQKLEEQLTLKKQDLQELTEKWNTEKKAIDDVKAAKSKLEQAKFELEQAQREGDYAKASKIQYAEIPQLQTKVIEFTKSEEAAKSSNLLHDSVTSDDIASVISKMTGIPLNSLLKGEKDKLLDMEATLEAEVVGQQEAIHAVSDAVRLHRAGLTDQNKPIASFVFLGSTGTGKTLLTKALAKWLFNDPNSVIRFDMSEFQEKHSVSRLISAPPGYVGYEEGGELTEAVRRRPYSIVLFDEVEKAHPDIVKILLQVLDEGSLTDTHGVKVSFKNTIIVMTSNLGQEILLADSSAKDDGKISPVVKTEVIDALKRHYPPEFLNRIEDIIVFNRLSKKSLKEILEIRLGEIDDRLLDKRIELKLTQPAKDLLIEKGYSPVYGARPLNRVLQKDLLNPLARLVLSGQIKNNEVAKVEVRNKEIYVVPNHSEKSVVEEEEHYWQKKDKEDDKH
ncbi:HSP78 [Candida jiufengensis]|uniref:HSP78 n=1 Tax=Candida jiufengensis TaxID=497108 RepID=UPI00222459E2|nr:HSP78 [Candida jiufengensis]KAI5951503.1 HSP78 [Candida jiufengensis]